MAPGTEVYNADVDLVDRHSEGRGAKAAYIDPDRHLTYAELKDRTDRLANGLRRRGPAQHAADHRPMALPDRRQPRPLRDRVAGAG
jgi:non-ribosomal peptide synthetase component E (peptide arylation enzyme)